MIKNYLKLAFKVLLRRKFFTFISLFGISFTLVVLMVLKQTGLPKLFDSFDADGDGALTRAELFADFRFDKRPFAKLAADPSAVDWATFGKRFGPIGALLASLLRPAPRRSQTAPPRR